MSLMRWIILALLMNLFLARPTFVPRTDLQPIDQGTRVQVTTDPITPVGCCVMGYDCCK
jgi:hypothetical protein